jgi:mycofactocin precursor
MDDDVVERTDDQTTDTTDAGSEELVEELLIEEISIDGMCGVY